MVFLSILTGLDRSRRWPPQQEDRFQSWPSIENKVYETQQDSFVFGGGFISKVSPRSGVYMPYNVVESRGKTDRQTRDVHARGLSSV